MSQPGLATPATQSVRRLTLFTRPWRVACIMDAGGGYEQVRQFLSVATGDWGGYHYLAVPAVGGRIAPEWLGLLGRYDPDYVVAYFAVDDDLAEAIHGACLPYEVCDPDTRSPWLAGSFTSRRGAGYHLPFPQHWVGEAYAYKDGQRPQWWSTYDLGGLTPEQRDLAGAMVGLPRGTLFGTPTAEDRAAVRLAELADARGNIAAPVADLAQAPLHQTVIGTSRAASAGTLLNGVLVLTSQPSVADFCLLQSLRACTHGWCRVWWATPDVSPETIRQWAWRPETVSDGSLTVVSGTMQERDIRGGLARLADGGVRAEVRSALEIVRLELPSRGGHDAASDPVSYPLYGDAVSVQLPLPVWLPHAPAVEGSWCTELHTVGVKVDGLALPQVRHLASLVVRPEDWDGKPRKRSGFAARVDARGNTVVIASVETAALRFAMPEPSEVVRFVLAAPAPGSVLVHFSASTGPPARPCRGFELAAVSDKGAYARRMVELLGGLDWGAFMVGDSALSVLELMAKAKGRFLTVDEIATDATLPARVVEWYVRETLPPSVFATGARLRCGACGLKSDLAVDDIGQQFRCPRCLRHSPTPIGLELGLRLDPTFELGIRNGQLVTLATLLLLRRGAAHSFIWQPETRLTRRASLGTRRERADMDIDLVAVADGRVVLGECEMGGNWKDSDYSKMEDLAHAVRPAEVVFASLADRLPPHAEDRIEDLAARLGDDGVAVTALLGHHLRRCSRDADPEGRYTRIGSSKVVHRGRCQALERGPRARSRSHYPCKADYEREGLRRCKVCLPPSAAEPSRPGLHPRELDRD